MGANISWGQRTQSAPCPMDRILLFFGKSIIEGNEQGNEMSCAVMVTFAGGLHNVALKSVALTSLVRSYSDLRRQRPAVIHRSLLQQE